MPKEAKALAYRKCAQLQARKPAPQVANNLSKASWSCVSAVDPFGRTIWIADAHRADGKRFVMRADEKLTAFLKLELDSSR
jgi:hypothetical protein